jgi:hypothetical protein
MTLTCTTQPAKCISFSGATQKNKCAHVHCVSHAAFQDDTESTNMGDNVDGTNNDTESLEDEDEKMPVGI